MVATIEYTSAEQCVETLILFRNDVAGKWLRQFLRYNPKKNNESYQDEMTMFADRVKTWVAAVVCRLLKKEEHRKRRKKACINMYGIMLRTTKRLLIETGRELV